MGVATFPPVLDLGGDYCYATPSSNVPSSPSDNLPCCFAHGLRAVTVVELLVVLNFVVPCIVDRMAWSQKRSGDPRTISSSDLCFTTENSFIVVIFSFLSWLSIINRRFMALSDHILRL